MGQQCCSANSKKFEENENYGNNSRRLTNINQNPNNVENNQKIEKNQRKIEENNNNKSCNERNTAMNRIKLSNAEINKKSNASFGMNQNLKLDNSNDHSLSYKNEVSFDKEKTIKMENEHFKNDAFKGLEPVDNKNLKFDSPKIEVNRNSEIGKINNFYLICPSCKNNIPRIEKMQYNSLNKTFTLSFRCNCLENNEEPGISKIDDFFASDPPSNNCEEHNQNKLFAYCENCNKQVCKDCIESAHKAHLINKEHQSDPINSISKADIEQVIVENEKKIEDRQEINHLEYLKELCKVNNNTNLSKFKTNNSIENKEISDFMHGDTKINSNINLNDNINKKPSACKKKNYDQDPNYSSTITSKSNFFNNFGSEPVDNIEIPENNSLKEFKLVKTLTPHINKIVYLTELQNHNIASCSYDQTIKVYDSDSMELILEKKEDSQVICLLEFTKNILLCGTEKNVINLWDLSEENNNCFFSFEGHNKWVNCLVKCNDNTFASGSNDSTIKIWDYENKALTSTITGHNEGILCLIKLKDGRLCSGSADHSIKIWNWESQICEITMEDAHEDWVRCIFQLNNGLLLSGGSDAIIYIWDIKDKYLNKRNELQGHDKSLRDFCQIDENTFASSSFDKTIKIWDINTNTEIQTLKGHNKIVTKIIYTSNHRLISCSNDQTIKIWEYC